MWNVNARWEKSYKNWLIEGWRELKLSTTAAAAADVVLVCCASLPWHHPHFHMPFCAYKTYASVCVCVCAGMCQWQVLASQWTQFNCIYEYIIIRRCSHACQLQYRKRFHSQSNCGRWTITHAYSDTFIVVAAAAVNVITLISLYCVHFSTSVNLCWLGICTL